MSADAPTVSDAEAPTPAEVAAPEPEVPVPTGHELTKVVEALLFVADKPLSYKKLRTVLGGVPTAQLGDAVEAIRTRLVESDAPLELRDIGGGLKLCTKQQYAPFIKKLYGVRAAAGKLSAAALETLAVVAYKQPVIRAEIEAIRGVASDSAMHTLLDRKLIETKGHRDVPGHPSEYGTTQDFLMYFGLNDVSELPTLEELRAESADADA